MNYLQVLINYLFKTIALFKDVEYFPIPIEIQDS
jgi:hypothetical protein